MWWLMLALWAAPAQAQRPGCDFGSGIAALRDAEAALAAPVPGLVQGRESALAVAARLDTAKTLFTGCGCPNLAGFAQEAARLAEQAGYEASVPRIAATFRQASFRALLAQQALTSTGCR